MKKTVFLFIVLIAFMIESFAISPVRVSTPVRVITPVRVSTPVKASTPVRVNTPVKTNTPVKAYSPTYKASTPVKATIPLKRYTYNGMPVYHQSSNMMLWYFILYNNHTHKNDTIRARSKEELQKKAEELKKTNQW